MLNYVKIILYDVKICANEEVLYMKDKEKTLELFEKMLELENEVDELKEKADDMIEQCHIAKSEI